jgi:hypothetical protein
LFQMDRIQILRKEEDWYGWKRQLCWCQ